MNSIQPERRGLFFDRYKDFTCVQKFNCFINSDSLFLAVIALLCGIGYVFSVEPFIYTLYCLICIAIALVGENVGRFILTVPFFYIMPSQKNNPAMNSGSIFLSPVILTVLISIAATALICVVVSTVKSVKRFPIKSKPIYLWSMLLLSLAYICSGLFSDSASLLNLVFSIGEAFALCLFYFVAFYSVDWKSFGKSTFAKIGASMGGVLLLELVELYINKDDIFSKGHITRRSLYTGWGIHNNLGNFICFCIPCVMYLIGKSKHKKLMTFYAVLLYAGVFATTSRGSIIVATILLVASLIYLFKKKEIKITKTAVIYLCGLIFVGLSVAMLLAVKYQDIIKATADKILKLGIMNDFGRFQTWKMGLQRFAENPIFGVGFYKCDAYLFGALEHNIPGRWHNTVVQLLAGCGLFGIGSYMFHRIQTVCFFWKYKTKENLFIALSVLAILLGTLVDNHFFNIGPTIVYGIFLAFAEGMTLLSCNAEENNAEQTHKEVSHG